MSAHLGFLSEVGSHKRFDERSARFFVRSEPRSRLFSAEHSETSEIKCFVLPTQGNSPPDSEDPTTQSFSSETRILEIVAARKNHVSDRAVSQLPTCFSGRHVRRQTCLCARREPSGFGHIRQHVRNTLSETTTDHHDRCSESNYRTHHDAEQRKDKEGQRKEREESV